MKSGIHWLVSFQFPNHEPIGFLAHSKPEAIIMKENMMSILGSKKYNVNIYKLNVVKNRIHPKRVKLDP